MVITPKKFGGLGIRDPRCVNVALLGKLVWQMFHSHDKLWEVCQNISLYNPDKQAGPGPGWLWNASSSKSYFTGSGYNWLCQRKMQHSPRNLSSLS
ncbi:hypothetical protein PIB30_060955 [Stylosanthes scabra]|uniref:Uncharacterized protein n=1 Tax=Stylosanthes scabra TaxID=79078 RepID=A0ABU6ZJE2_9FABA|nr:hypothetical protein [Stylosanthes scabra]